MTTRSLAFRPDINGLRAVAVLAVLAFHFGVTPLAGGFVGVDVFFVISGYLMTGIVLSRIERGSFSIPGFYLDRARRIVPALAVLAAAVLALGCFILLPDELLILGKHAASAVTFSSNMLFWRESGYFDSGIEQKWLLHTWSLSVEWQFYLLYPLVLAAVARWTPRRAWVPLLGIGALLSVGLMLAIRAAQPSAAFYLLPPRAWEMLVGGLVYLAPALPARTTRAAQLAGLAAILIAAIWAPQASWPGPWTLVPVLGAALVILARRTDSRVTGNPVAAWVGLNSYSIYLWHWPLVVLLHRSGHFGAWGWTLAAFALSLLLGHLSWRFVERLAQPATRRPHGHAVEPHGGWRAHAIFAAPVVALTLAGGAVWQARGIPQRFSAEVQAAANDSLPRHAPGGEACYADIGEMPADHCMLGPAASPVLAIVRGDSQADAELHGVIAAIPAGMQGGVDFAGYSDCAPILGGHRIGTVSRCGEFLERSLAPLARPRTTPLVLISRWTYHADNFTTAFAPGAPGADGTVFRAHLYQSLCTLAKAGPTYAVLPLPEFPWWVSRELAHRLIADPRAPDIDQPVAEYQARNAPQIAVMRRAQRECGLRLLDPAPYLCLKGRCMGSIGHRAVFRDEQHVSTHGAELLAPMFAQVFTAGARP